MNRQTVNQIKSKIVNSCHYLEKVFDTGFETYEQFQSFCNMCGNHVNMCNMYCKQIKPAISIVQRKRTHLYKDIRLACECTVDIINNMIYTWQSGYEQTLEDTKIKSQLEDRIRLEHEIAIEYSNAQYEKNKKKDNKVVVGFPGVTNKKNKRKKNND